MAEPKPSDFDFSLAEADFSSVEDELFASDPERADVRTMYVREREQAFIGRGKTDIPLPPEWVTDQTLEAFDVHNLRLRYLPITPDDSTSLPNVWERAMAQNSSDPGWYMLYDRPLNADDLAELFEARARLRMPDCPPFEFGIRLPPRKVREFYSALTIVNEAMPVHRDDPVRLPTVSELAYLTRTAGYDTPDGEVLCNNGDDFNSAISLTLENDHPADVSNYQLKEPFSGSIMPMRKIS